MKQIIFVLIVIQKLNLNKGNSGVEFTPLSFMYYIFSPNYVPQSKTCRKVSMMYGYIPLWRREGDRAEAWSLAWWRVLVPSGTYNKIFYLCIINFCDKNLFSNNNPSQIVDSSHKPSCGAQNRQGLLLVADDFDRYASLRSLHRPPDALTTSPVAFIYIILLKLKLCC